MVVIDEGSTSSVCVIMRLDPNDADAYVSRGATQHTIGMYEFAIADFGEAIRLNPQEAIPYALRALSYVDLANFLDTEKTQSPFGDAGHLLESAIQDYKNLIRLDPHIVDNPDIFFDTIALAAAYRQLKDFGQAKEMLDRYVAGFPKDTADEKAKNYLRGVYLVRASVHNQMGEPQLAMQDVEEAISIDPQLASSESILAFKRSISVFDSEQGYWQGIANVMRQERQEKLMPPDWVPAYFALANVQDELWESANPLGRSLIGFFMGLAGRGDKARDLERRRLALRALEKSQAEEEWERENRNFANDLIAERWGFPKGTSEAELYGSAQAPEVPTHSIESPDAGKD